jgi:acyl-CoA reductase-like NAD-dependent aldehyde dehydrogenase
MDWLLDRDGPGSQSAGTRWEPGLHQSGAKEGAKLVYGGERLLDGDLAHGYFMQPAVLTDVTPTARIAREEVFGL